jgi:hypothetical protein
MRIFILLLVLSFQLSSCSKKTSTPTFKLTARGQVINTSDYTNTKYPPSGVGFAIEMKKGTIVYYSVGKRDAISPILIFKYVVQSGGGKCWYNL